MYYRSPSFSRYPYPVAPLRIGAGPQPPQCCVDAKTGTILCSNPDNPLHGMTYGAWNGPGRLQACNFSRDAAGPQPPRPQVMCEPPWQFSGDKCVLANPQQSDMTGGCIPVPKSWMRNPANPDQIQTGVQGPAGWFVKNGRYVPPHAPPSDTLGNVWIWSQGKWAETNLGQLLNSNQNLAAQWNKTCVQAPGGRRVVAFVSTYGFIELRVYCIYAGDSAPIPLVSKPQRALRRAPVGPGWIQAPKLPPPKECPPGFYLWGDKCVPRVPNPQSMQAARREPQYVGPWLPGDNKNPQGPSSIASNPIFGLPAQKPKPIAPTSCVGAESWCKPPSFCVYKVGSGTVGCVSPLKTQRSIAANPMNPYPQTPGSATQPLAACPPGFMVFPGSKPPKCVPIPQNLPRDPIQAASLKPQRLGSKNPPGDARTRRARSARASVPVTGGGYQPQVYAYDPPPKNLLFCCLSADQSQIFCDDPSQYPGNQFHGSPVNYNPAIPGQPIKPDIYGDPDVLIVRLGYGIGYEARVRKNCNPARSYLPNPTFQTGPGRQVTPPLTANPYPTQVAARRAPLKKDSGGHLCSGGCHFTYWQGTWMCLCNCDAWPDWGACDLGPPPKSPKSGQGAAEAKRIAASGGGLTSTTKRVRRTLAENPTFTIKPQKSCQYGVGPDGKCRKTVLVKCGYKPDGTIKCIPIKP